MRKWYILNKKHTQTSKYPDIYRGKTTVSDSDLYSGQRGDFQYTNIT